jgi:hypothetical protein
MAVRTRRRDVAHEVTVADVNDVAVCRWCGGPVTYVDALDIWAHWLGDDLFDHDADVEFLLDVDHLDAWAGDGFVLVTDDGSWIGDIVDVVDGIAYATPW